MPADKILTDAELEAIHRHNEPQEDSVVGRLLDSHAAVSLALWKRESERDAAEDAVAALRENVGSLYAQLGGGEGNLTDAYLYFACTEMVTEMKARIEQLETAANSLVEAGWHSYDCQCKRNLSGDGICSCGLTKARNQMRQALAQPATPRCLVTGNPVGTDTRMVGSPCQCVACKPVAPEAKPRPWDDPSWSPSPPEAKEEPK
jgi:hypothetical protein